MIVRRTERALGVAIREGQERGEVETRESAMRISAHNREARKRGEHESLLQTTVPKPLDFASHSELYNEKGGITHLTNNVTDAEFEEALAVAKGEGNVSRANVVRKLRGESAPLPKTRKTSPILSRSIDGLAGYSLVVSGWLKAYLAHSVLGLIWSETIKGQLVNETGM